MSLSKFALGTALFATAYAIPQKPDFAAIAAAPTVASGPVAENADAIQTASLLTSFVIAGPTAAASTIAAIPTKRALQRRDQVISNSGTDASVNVGFGRSDQLTTINHGVDYWINGGTTHNFWGNINNYGRLFVSQTDWLKRFPFSGGQTSDWVGHDVNSGNLQNAAGALIQLNDFGSASAPTYDWYIRSMNNQGTIQFCGRGDTGGSTYQLYNDLTSNNTGLISFEQFFDNFGASFVWRNPALTTTSMGQNLYNNGAFRIINVNYHNVQNIYGNGCWQIGKGGILYLEDGTGAFQNPSAGPSFPGQSIQFQDSSAILHMDTAVYSRNSNFGAQVYGYGQGNAIEFYETIQSFVYNPTSGILNVRLGGSRNVNILIGQGYNASKFAKRNNRTKYANFNAIFYDGPAPSQSVPSKCGITAPMCSDLSGGLPPSSPSQPSTTSTTSVVSSTSTSTTTSAVSTSTTSKASPTSTTVSTTSATTSATTSSTTTSVRSSTSTTSQASSTTTISTSQLSSTTTSSLTTSKPTTPPNTCPYTPYTPYYAALSTGYTKLPGPTTPNAPCPTQPKAGTPCGVLNPSDPCAPQPDGYGPVPTPDTASAFLAFSQLHASASAAPTVVPSKDGTQYTQIFKDLNGATSAQSYLGLYTLKTYNTSECAAKCDCTELCTAFNLYAERSPSLRPSTNDTAETVWGNYCPNPHSMTSWKCTLWGSSIDASTATNKGEKRDEFEVVITASNGYDKTNVTIPPGGPEDCGAKAIDAPEFWLGSRFFPGPFNPLVCGDYAAQQSAANTKAGQLGVKMYNAYYLNKNGVPFGTQCSLYNSVLDPAKYATYSGATVGRDRYDCMQSYIYAM